MTDGRMGGGGDDVGTRVDEQPPGPDSRATPAHTFAVVVGIDRYPGFGDLSGARRDAIAFRDWLVDPAGAGVPAANVRLRLSGRARTLRGARPLKCEIDRDLEDIVRLARRTPAPTRLYLYFSGHGIAPLHSSAAGVMANADARNCWNISFGTYVEWFRRCRDVAEVVMLTDCCRTAREVEAGAPQHDTCAPGAKPRQLRLVAHATDMDGLAFESRAGGELVRGHFTAALLDGLRGAAADPGTGVVDALTLAAYLEVEVRRRSGGRQWPDIDPSFPPLVLAGGSVAGGG